MVFNGRIRESWMKAKILLLLIVAAVLSVSALAQNEMPTKEETVNYLNKKLHEVDGRYFVFSDGDTIRFSGLSFRMKGDSVELKRTEQRANGTVDYEILEFDPGHISKIVVQRPKGKVAVNYVSLYFATKVARRTCCFYGAKPLDVDYGTFPYFEALPDNALKIQKALLHLRDLYKAEEDPFDN